MSRSTSFASINSFGCKVGAETEMKAVNTLLKRQSDIVVATVTLRSLADFKAAMLSLIQSQMDWQKAIDDMLEACGVDARMNVRSTTPLCCASLFIIPPPLIGGGIKRCFCLTSVCLGRLHRA